MTIKTLVTSVMVLLPLFAQAAPEVRVAELSEVAQCKKLDHQVCTTIRSNAVEDCVGWHKEAAGKVDADVVVLGQHEQTKQRRPSLAGSKIIIKSDIAADYFDCGFPATPVKGSAATTAQPVPNNLNNIEERLKVLESLKAKGLVTEKEYRKKRQDILSEI